MVLPVWRRYAHNRLVRELCFHDLICGEQIGINAIHQGAVKQVVMCIIDQMNAYPDIGFRRAVATSIASSRGVVLVVQH
jgi:hypothetical protein